MTNIQIEGFKQLGTHLSQQLWHSYMLSFGQTSWVDTKSPGKMEKCDSPLYITGNTKNKPSFEQNDVEDGYGTCPEEKNHNVPEQMAQKW